MDELKAVNLGEIMTAVTSSGRPNTVLWQTPDSIAFVARGREFRSEFHEDPSDEVMYMIRGDMQLHYRTPDGAEKVAVIREGEIVHCPAGTPHSPRFSPDAFVLVLERKRRGGEDDRFTWFCASCGAQLHQSVTHVADYREDPVSRAYEEFYGSDAHRTCGRCGHVAESHGRPATGPPSPPTLRARSESGPSEGASRPGVNPGSPRVQP